jgi:hypothetical protein
MGESVLEGSNAATELSLAVLNLLSFPAGSSTLGPHIESMRRQGPGTLTYP